jgi:hypothetical protein
LPLVAEATAEERDGGRAAAKSSIFVEIAPVADPPLLALDDAVGFAGEAVALSIRAARVDLDGSERLSVLIAGLPKGASLSAGTDIGGDVWRVSSRDLAQLTLAVPSDVNGDFGLEVQAVAEEAEGARAVTTAEMAVAISRRQEAAAFVAESTAAAASKLTESLAGPAAVGTDDPPGSGAAPADEGAVPAPGAEWLARGDKLLSSGDFAAARLYYELAAEEGHGSAATAVGKTFDPRFLSDLGVLGSPGNPDKAILWYQRGIDEGDAEAIRRLSALRAWLGQ